MTEQGKSPKLLVEKLSPEKKGQRDIIYICIYDTIYIYMTSIYTQLFSSKVNCSNTLTADADNPPHENWAYMV